jgi:hypothetical protein
MLLFRARSRSRDSEEAESLFCSQPISAPHVGGYENEHQEDLAEIRNDFCHPRR